MCCLLAGGIFLAYAFASRAAGRGEFIMPLDDVYIHFQYAKQLAAGQPYVYNPGLPPSSGATSFLYPFILAAGYLLGFQGLNLGLWAMAVGAVALAGSMWLVYRLVKVFGAPEWLAGGAAVIFALSGPVSWHFMSGMETGLVVLFTLWMVYALNQFLNASGRGEPPVRPYRQFIAAATLMALIRPEGAILTLLGVGAVALTPTPSPSARGEQMWIQRFLPRLRRGGQGVGLRLLIPILAIGVQPVVNLIFTGSTVASGNAAKSVLGIVPFEWGEAIRRIAENFVRIWGEFFTGISPREGMYLLPGMLVLAAVGVIYLVRARHALSLRACVLFVLVIVGWLVGGTLAISTLDTAFWHFKRYQMPFVALLFPLAGWGIAVFSQNTKRIVQFIAGVLSVVLFASSLWTWPPFLQHYALNVSYVYLQPYQMARWLQANTPEDAVVAVHDTGLLRYMGGRTTIDMVGLTTPGAANYWRNGPGSVAEFLMDKRPDYIAAYGPGHGFGLSMVADTDVYGRPLAEFPVILDDRYNVALAAAYQGIYKPEWESIKLWPAGLQTSVWNYFPEDMTWLAHLNVADLEAEHAADYRWSNQPPLSGFPTEVHELEYIDCIYPDLQNRCLMVDGGRRINGEEAFTLALNHEGIATDGLLLITRLQSVGAANFDVYANGAFVATRWIPDIPGHWLEVPTRIPNPGRDSTNRLQIRIVPHGLYAPYYHSVNYALDSSSIDNRPETRIATYQSGAMMLASAGINYQPGEEQLGVNFEWYTDGSATGDYIAFVHLYDDVNQPPVAQTDIRPGGGTLPPGNWLPGVLHDIISVDVKDVPPGKYQVATGFYDPITFERLAPDAGGDANGRLFIGEVEIKAP